MTSRTPFKNLRLALAAGALAVVPTCATFQEPGPATVRGCVLDSACAFLKDLDKPISKECAIKCAKAGSPLVILADDGTIYLPISNAMPAVGLNDRLLEFAGDRVVASGTTYEKGGSHALVIGSIEHEPAK